jgi:hypothetical protein
LFTKKVQLFQKVELLENLFNGVLPITNYLYFRLWRAKSKMTVANQIEGWRSLGLALLGVVVVFMIGAFAAAYFRPPIPTEPLEKLERIANDRTGWTIQAILFPVAYLGTAVVFGLIAARIPDSGSRWPAIGATILITAGLFFWLPISAGRLEVGRNAAEMIRTFNPGSPPEVMLNSWSFWPNTLAVLAAIALMGAALALAGVLPSLGWIVAGLAVLGLIVGPFIMHDWPPFMSYVILLVMAIGLIKLPEVFRIP